MHTGRCTADCIRFAVPADPTLWTLNSSPAIWIFESWGVLGEPLGALGSSWRVLGHLLGTSWSVLGSWNSLGGVLESLWSDFGGYPIHLGSFLDGHEAILEALWELLGSKSDFKGHLSGSKKVPNRLAETTWAQNGETTKLEHSTKDFNVFFKSQTLFALKRLVQNSIIDKEKIKKTPKKTKIKKKKTVFRKKKAKNS